jgi:hypothetical protein
MGSGALSERKVQMKKGVWQWVAGATTLLASATTPVTAALSSTQRISTFTVTFAGNNFSNAVVDNNVDQTIVGNAGDTDQTGTNLKPNYSNLFLSSTGGITIGNQTLVPSSPEVDYSLTSDGTPGHIVVNYQSPAIVNLTGTPSFNDTFDNIIKNSHGDYALDLFFTGSGGVESGGDFTVNAVFDGDWSSLGSGPGQADVLSFNNNFAISKDFVYDSSTQTTDFSATDSNYNGISNIAFNVVLNSDTPVAPAPEASPLVSFGLLTIGGAMLATFKRKRAQS